MVFNIVPVKEQYADVHSLLYFFRVATHLKLMDVLLRSAYCRYSK